MFKSMAWALVLLLASPWPRAAVPAAQARPQMVVQLGETGHTKAVAVTPDGRYALTGGGVAPILWDLASGAQLRNFEAGPGGVASMALSPDGKRLACGLLDGGVRLFDMEDGRILRTLPGHEGAVDSLAFSPDGSLLASGGQDECVRLWQVATGANTRTFRTGHWVMAVAISPDGLRIAAAGIDRAVQLWRLADGQELPPLRGHEAMIETLAFSPDSRLLASAGHDRTVRLWDMATFAQTRVLTGSTSQVNAIAFSPDGLTLAAAAGQYNEASYAVRLWTVADGAEIRKFRGNWADVQCLAFTPDGRKLLTGHANKVRVWDVQHGGELLTLAGHASSANEVRFSPDGRYLATAQNDATARLWDLRQGMETRVFKGHGNAVSGVAFSADGQWLGTASYDQTARIWNVADGRTRETLKGHGSVVKDVVFSPDGRFLFTSSVDKTGRKWSTHGGSALGLLGGHEGVINHLAVSPDGRLVATAGQDRTARVWDADSGACVMSLEHPAEVEDVAFLPDGKHLLTGCKDLNGYLWSLDSRQVVRTFLLGSPAGAVAASADGARIALGGWNGDLALFDPGTGRQLVSVPQPKGFIGSIAFSPDGSRLATTVQGGGVQLWETATLRPLVQFFSLDQGWVAITPDGYFDGSPDGLKAIRWTVGMQSFPLEAFSEQYYVPALLGRINAGQPFAAPQQADVSKGFALPPLVRISSPADGAGLEAGEVEVRVEATDQGGGIDEIRLYLNGKAVEMAGRGVKVAPGPVRTEVFRVALADGENRLRAVALNGARIESNPSEVKVQFRGPARQSVLNVLAVGIDRYKNEAMNLNFARADAGAVADFFTSAPKGLFQRVDAVRLFDGDATKAAILAGLERFRGLPPQDVAVIYLAGHGEAIDNTWYFLPFELVYPEQEEQVRRKGLSSQELQEAIRAIGAQKVLVLLDACKSGEALQAFAGRGVEDRKALATLARATGVHIIAASTKDQLASEVKALGHGVFTYTLLQGLKGAAGGPGPVTVRRLLAYVEDQLPEVSQKYKTQAQYPVVDSRGMDFPIAAPN